MSGTGTTAYDWLSALAELEWSRAELARRLGLHHGTVLGWGRDAIPSYAVAYLRLAVDVRRLGRGLDRLRGYRGDGAADGGA